MANKKVTRISAAADLTRGVVKSYDVKGYPAEACELDAKAIELGFKPDFRLNVMEVAGESLLEAVLPFCESDVYLSLTNNRDAEEVARLRDKPQSLADYAAVRLGRAVREYIDAKRL